MTSLQIESRHLRIIKNILNQYPYQFYVFGSRAKGNASKYSDLDLAYNTNIPKQDLNKIETSFAESDLPYKVDIIDLNKINNSFKEAIKDDLRLDW